MNNDKPIRIAGLHKHLHLEHEVEGVASGIALGALLGAAAGPPGILAGAILGAAAGAITVAGMEVAAKHTSARSEELDLALGISGGSIGAPNLDHPPPSRGVFSGGSLGVGGPAEESPAEGPMQSPETD